MPLPLPPPPLKCSYSLEDIPPSDVEATDPASAPASVSVSASLVTRVLEAQAEAVFVSRFQIGGWDSY